jgi:hypothetical protein
MKYLLVIQFRGDSVGVLDTVVAIEDEFIELLGQPAVDGHDIGMGECNIFIFTDDPNATFTAVKPVLRRNGHLKTIKAAYRDVEGEDYTILWPRNFKGEFGVAY